MVQIDWGNMVLALAAPLGMVGLLVYFGVAILANKPPRSEPKMDEPQLKVFWPGHTRR